MKLLATSLTAACIAVGGTFISVPVAATDASAAQCVSNRVAVTGGARGSQGPALRSAQRQWRARAIAQAGVRYAMWNRAQDKGESCKRVGGKHICTVSALPCS